MFSNPEQNVLQLGLKEGMKVADFGAGTGAYSIASSKKVGHTGHVYSIEVQKELLKRFEKEIRDHRLSNISCIWGDIEKVHGTKIADRSIDAVIIANVLFQTEDKIGVLDEARRILKKGGKVLFIDWLSSFSGMGPAGDHVVDPKMVTELFNRRGFKILEKINTNSHHYGIIFIHE